MTPAAAHRRDRRGLRPRVRADQPGRRPRERYPILRTDDLVGAIWLPGDGTANPTDLTQSLARGRPRPGRADRRADPGHRHRPARRRASPACAPTTATIEAEIVVNCAGQWAKAVGALAGVTVPLHSAEHFYVVTEQIDGVHRDLPILRDPDGYTYFKEEVGGLVVGGFEPEAKPWVAPDAAAPPVRVPAAGRGLGALLGAHGQRGAPAAGARTHRHQEVLQRSGELHSRQPVHARRGAGAAQLLRRGRLQLGRHRVRGRGRAGRWPSGSSRASRRRTCPVWTSAGSPRSTATTSGCATGSARSSACTTRCRGRTAS